MAKKFKVGDKVRYIEKGGWFPVGAILYVIKAEDIGEMNHMLSESIDGKPSASSSLWVHADEIELVESKPSKNERISLLESQVAELQAKVEALQKPKFEPKFYCDGKQLGKTQEIRMLTPNEQRKAVIDRAEFFVAIQEPLTGRRVEYVVNAEKRTVVALIYRIAFRGERNGLYAKAIAKCAPDDVFNADIGKAIALGRALGLDVSEFENAVKPTEFAAGQVMTYRGRKQTITEIDGDKARINKDDFHWTFRINEREYVIIDDTEAQY